MEEKLLFTSRENLDIIQVIGILEENKIPYIKRHEGIGQYMSITMGKSYQIQNIYVSEDKYNEAKQLILNFIEPIKDNTDEVNECETDKLRTFKKLRRIVFIIIYGIPLIIVIIALILLFLGKI